MPFISSNITTIAFSMSFQILHWSKFIISISFSPIILFTTFFIPLTVYFIPEVTLANYFLERVYSEASGTGNPSLNLLFYLSAYTGVAQLEAESKVNRSACRSSPNICTSWNGLPCWITYLTLRLLAMFLLRGIWELFLPTPSGKEDIRCPLFLFTCTDSFGTEMAALLLPTKVHKIMR